MRLSAKLALLIPRAKEDLVVSISSISVKQQFGGNTQGKQITNKSNIN